MSPGELHSPVSMNSELYMMKDERNIKSTIPVKHRISAGASHIQYVKARLGSGKSEGVFIVTPNMP